MKRFLVILMVITVIFSLNGCERSNMPFNGDISFYDITLTVPGDFIRDSTQSSSDTWIFEKNFYKQVIIIKCNELKEGDDTALQDYADFIVEQGGEAEMTDFAGCDAVRLTYTRDDVFCQELLFNYNNSTYTVALRGATEEEFEDLLDTCRISEK